MTQSATTAAGTALPKIAVLGIGMMGYPMARRLCEAGFELHAWNRSRDKADRLAASGANVHDTAAQAVAAADIVITLLLDGDAGSNVLFHPDNAPVWREGQLVVDMSSIRPDQAREHAERLAEYGVGHLDAPVSGGTVGAEQGTLAIMVGGEASAFERVLPVFRVLGRATHVGGHGAGQLAKLANQMIVGITIGAVAEALLLCEKGGADIAKVREAIGGGFAESRVLQLHGLRMVERDFAKRAALSVQLKDMRNARLTAESLDFHAPITTLFEKLYSQAVADGLGDIDHAGLFVELARRNGMT
jgi:2-hydroxy-3-oxopropionate reductase